MGGHLGSAELAGTLHAFATGWSIHRARLLADLKQESSLADTAVRSYHGTWAQLGDTATWKGARVFLGDPEIHEALAGVGKLGDLATLDAHSLQSSVIVPISGTVCSPLSGLHAWR